MSRPPTGLVVRAVAYFALRDLIPLYGVYALLFRDAGMSAAAISSLFIVWSVTAFVAEVPSGAWADMVSRRMLLAASSVLYALGFSAWLVVPSYPGFAAGFVLWGLSGALMSGTFEALLYDELARHGAQRSYGPLMGWANAAAVATTLIGIAAATPLLALGGYALVGWVSVAVAALQAVVALALPPAPRVAVVDGTAVPATDGVIDRYVATLRRGVAEATHTPVVRRAVLLVALLAGLLACDEYFPLVAREHGAATPQVPLIMALVYAGEGLGTALAGRAERLRGRTLGWLLGGAAAALAAGALSGHPAGFAAIAVGYGIGSNLIVVSEARLQHAMPGTARATVTSVSGLLSEASAVALFAAVAAGSTALPVATMVGLVGLPLLLAAALLPRWLAPSHP